MRIAFVAVVGLYLCLAVPAAAQEAVALSRYRLVVTVVTSGLETDDVDLAAIEERCEDADGCQVTLMSSPTASGGVVGVHARLFLTQTNWSVEQRLGISYGSVANGSESILGLGFNPDQPSCVFGDTHGGGFYLELFSGFPTSCVLTIMD